ncbi:MAG: DUF6782 family putative metallopeptidase [Promethearchaeota archaeon]
MRSISTTIGDVLREIPRRSGEEALKDIFDMGVEMTPVVGDIQQVYEAITGEGASASKFVTGEEQRDLGNIERIILAATALLPVVPVKTIFTALKRAPIEKINDLKKLVETGASAEKIREETRIFKNIYDKKIRYEVPDFDSSFTTDWDQLISGRQFGSGFGEYKLGNVFEHEELYKIYPELKDLKVEKKQLFEPGTKGYYNPDTETITLNSNLNPEEAKESLLHEVQHWVQFKEGFAIGSTPSLDIIEEHLPKLRQQYERKLLDPDITYQSKMEVGQKLFDLKEVERTKGHVDQLAIDINNLNKKIDLYDKQIEQKFTSIDQELAKNFEDYRKAPNMAEKDRIRDNIERLRSEKSKIMVDSSVEDMKRELSSKLQNLDTALIPYKSVSYDIYRSFAGEIEANEVALRLDKIISSGKPFDSSMLPKPSEAFVEFE